MNFQETIAHYKKIIDGELNLLFEKKIKEILRSAIKNRGTTFRDHRDSQGKKGSFQNKLKVYGRQGQPCVDCRKILKHKRIGQRATVFCVYCQK